MPPCRDFTISEDVVEKEESQSDDTYHSYDPILKGFYIVTTYLCIHMVFWILFAPASWLIERSRFHREVLIPFLEERDIFWLVPASVVFTKYQGHTLVQVLHFLPGAVWAGLIPFQLHPTWRKNHRRLHRIFGYAFLMTSLLVATGVFVILQRNLTYEHFFPDLQPPRGFHVHIQTPIFLAMTSWYTFTALQAVRVTRTDKYRLHQKWMYRHVAAGLWVAVQRLITIPIIMAVLLLFFLPSRKDVSPWVQRESFAASGELSIVVTIFLGEYACQRAMMMQPSPQPLLSVHRKLE